VSDKVAFSRNGDKKKKKQTKAPRRYLPFFVKYIN
jgi:hypothetical protein